MFKLGCTLPNLLKMCLHKSTNKKTYPVCESDRDLSEKISEDMMVGPPILFTRKAVVDKTIIKDSSNNNKSIVGIDTSQLCPYSMCQDISTVVYTRWEFDSDIQEFRARHNRSRNFRKIVMTIMKQDHKAKLRASTHLEIKQKLIVPM